MRVNSMKGMLNRMTNVKIFIWKSVIKDDNMFKDTCNARGKISKVTEFQIKKHNKTQQKMEHQKNFV